ncbi:MAG: hypothetical protein AAFV25_00310 [Bacteroidota bacterium]
MESLSFQYPSWYLLFCAALGLVYAAVLYFKDDSFKEQPPLFAGLLALLRFLAVTFIAVLLLSPLLKSIITETKKPIVVLAQDQSESVGTELKEGQLQKYQSDFNNLQQELSQQYELKQYSFGDKVREGIDFAFDDKVSNLSDMLQSLYDLYSNQNLGAVILATDGIYNEGSNPVYIGQQLGAPIYTVALGDTTPKRDLTIKRIFNNKIAYLGDRFSVQVDVDAQNCEGSNTTLFVSKIVDGKSQRLQQFPISINRKSFFTTQEVILDAERSGVQRYRFSLGKVDNEVTTANNTKDIFVDVLDARQKVLILANSPHPDLSAIKQSILKNKNYQVNTAYISALTEDVTSYDFVILHQLPSVSQPATSLLNQLDEKKIPRLFVLGTQSNFSQFNQAQSLIKVTADGKNTNDVEAKVAANFSLFNISDEFKQDLPRFSPLLAPFGEFQESANAQILLYQRIGKIETQYPLLLFGEENNTKVGVLCAEGSWKWRLFDFLQRENHEVFDELVGKSVQYLSLKEDKRKFRISISKNIFNENESIVFDAELYNESYELINEPDVSLVITNSEGKDFNFTFNKNGRSYRLDAGFFPVGNYKFRGLVSTNGKQLTYDGQFSVSPIQLEVFETTANHGLLKLLSEKYGGELLYPGQIGEIATRIQEKGTVKPVLYQTSKTRSVINLRWLFFLLLGLLTVEWVLRRYFGAY